jgi:hypothetical protein
LRVLLKGEHVLRQKIGFDEELVFGGLAVVKKRGYQLLKLELAWGISDKLLRVLKGRIEPASWKDEVTRARRTMARTRAATLVLVVLHLLSMVKSVDNSSYLEMNPSWETSIRLCCLQVGLFNVDIRTAPGTRLTPLWILTELRDVEGVSMFESRRTKAVKKKKRKGPTLKATNTVDLVRVEDCAPLKNASRASAF